MWMLIMLDSGRKSKKKGSKQLFTVDRGLSEI